MGDMELVLVPMLMLVPLLLLLLLLVGMSNPFKPKMIAVQQIIRRIVPTVNHYQTIRRRCRLKGSVLKNNATKNLHAINCRRHRRYVLTATTTIVTTIVTTLVS